ncbi:MAG: hypothetical protein HY220_00080 [Candidatus Sungbacteria bacterium]|uniref:Zinc-finger domain-containing protein n=1 Tax=Candidatus Sungiibacteriota bacterium TaxID=2750080 RepID=A0A9D6LP86_9BACT|nr:hypothetical protein [Candidatus Sungbacteria bacterium]
MSCPWVEKFLSAYPEFDAGADLPEAAAEEFSAHLDTCPICLADEREFERIFRQLRSPGLTCSEVDALMSSEVELTEEMESAIETHVMRCAECIIKDVQTNADAEELLGKILDKVSEEEWRRLFLDTGHSPEVTEEVLKEIRQTKAKRKKRE